MLHYEFPLTLISSSSVTSQWGNWIIKSIIISIYHYLSTSLYSLRVFTLEMLLVLELSFSPISLCFWIRVQMHMKTHYPGHCIARSISDASFLLSPSGLPHLPPLFLLWDFGMIALLLFTAVIFFLLVR